MFVLDCSGSMSGKPINSLKMSLSNSIKYINSTNYIGVVSYSNGVNVELEIGQFDINQQAYFMGAVDSLTASGNTATYSALSRAVIMPIYTIGYNADLDELKAISEMNEAATINADTDDVIYQLKNLFNANL